MTGLLISVRSAREAREALFGGADVIDVKDPMRGALGAAEPAVWTEVLSEVSTDRPRATPVSAALGEICEADPHANYGALAGFQFAKWGLAGCRRRPDWPRQWAERLAQLPPNVIPVAVVYADWTRAEAPAPARVIAAAAALRCGAVLFDTYDKTGGCLLDQLSVAELGALADQARSLGLRVVLGGGLSPATIPQTLPLRPWLVAVRGAACRSGRTGDIDADCVRALRAAVCPTA